MYGIELTANILKLVLSGEALTVSEIKNALIKAYPGSFKYEHQQKALYHRILRHIHILERTGVIKIKAELTQLKTVKYKICLASESKVSGR